MIALLDRAGLDALQVAAGSRLGHGDRGDQFPSAELRQPALLLLFVRQVQQVRRHDVVVQAETDAAVTPGRGFLGDDRVVPEIGVSTAAVLLGHGHAEEALFTGFEPHAAVDDLRLLPLVVIGRDMAVQEAPVGLAEQVMFGLEKSALVFDGTAHGGPPAIRRMSVSARQRYTNQRLVGNRSRGCRTPADWRPAPPEPGP